METHLLEIRDNQKATWNKFSPGWKKWDNKIMEFLKPMGDEMIRSVDLKETDYILDVASGTGEPGLSIASIIKEGNVMITDLAEDMLEVARENAVMRGIANVEFMECDVSELPFEDDTFDSVCCRLGFMFFPDMELAADEMIRVLKPGGKIITSVWCIPDKNFWVTAMGSTINRIMQIPPPEPGAPGMFRCAESGMIEDLFKLKGMKNTTEVEVEGKLNCGTAENYWNMMTDVAAPFVAALSNADEDTVKKIKSEVIGILNQKFPDGEVIINGSSFVICGEK